MYVQYIRVFISYLLRMLSAKDIM